MLRNLITNKDYDAATRFLEAAEKTEKNTVLLSLLYRIKADWKSFVKERNLIFDTNFSNDYLNARKNTVDLPLREQLEVRQILDESPHPTLVPSQQILDNACLVTFGSTEVFDLVCDCIECVKTLTTYKDLPHCLVEFHNHEFTDEQKHILFNEYGIKAIRKPDFEKFYPGYLNYPFVIDFPNEHPRHQFDPSIPFMTEIFPEYQYVCHLEADVFVNARSMFDKIFYILETQGVSAVKPCGFAVHAWNRESSLLKQYQRTIQELASSGEFYEPLPKYDDPLKNAYAFSLRNFKAVASLKAWWQGKGWWEENIFIHAYAGKTNTFDVNRSETDNYVLFYGGYVSDVGVPFFDERQRLLCPPWSVNSPICQTPGSKASSIHLSTHPTLEKNLYYLPACSNFDIDKTEHLENTEKIKNMLIEDIYTLDAPKDYDNWEPIRARYVPYSNIEELKQFLYNYL